LSVTSQNATSATLTWAPFTGGASVTQTVALTPGQTTRIDPNASVPQGTQYAVTVNGSGTLAAIVMELHAAGGEELRAERGPGSHGPNRSRDEDCAGFEGGRQAKSRSRPAAADNSCWPRAARAPLHFPPHRL